MINTNNNVGQASRLPPSEEKNEDILNLCAVLLLEFMKSNIESFTLDTVAQQANLAQQQKNLSISKEINRVSVSTDEFSRLARSSDKEDVKKLEILLGITSIDQQSTESRLNSVHEEDALLRQTQTMLSTTANQKSNSVTETQSTVKAVNQTITAMVNQSSR